MSELSSFLNDVIYPSLWDKIDSVFPDFVRRGGGWQSNQRINGEETERADRTVITKKYPNRALENGSDSRSVSLIDLYLERNWGEDFKDALSVFAQAVGVALPEYNTEQYKKYKEREELLERVSAEMQKALFTEEGKSVLKYLKEVRKYSEETIKAMQLGVLTKAAEEELFKAKLLGSEEYDKKTGGYEPTKGYTSIYHPLAIPFTSGGKIYGFKFRAIKEDKIKYINSNFLPKNERLFGLRPLKVSGTNRASLNLTLVEGELDALHAQIVGIENIAAIAGGAGAGISEDHIKQIKSKGVKFITLLMDSDEAGRKFVKNALPLLAENGFSIFIATIPEGEGKDTDEYLGSHSKEDLQKLIENAVPLSIYYYNQLEAAYLAKDKESGVTEKDFEIFKKEVISLFGGIYLSSESGKEYNYELTPTEIDRLKNRFNEAFGGKLITAEAIVAEAAAIKNKKNEIRQQRGAEDLAKELSKAAAEGRIENFFSLIEEKGSKLKGLTKENKFSKLLESYDMEAVQRELAEVPNAIQTNFPFVRISGKGNDKEYLRLPSGAITFICGGTSHGKSKMLQNLALQSIAAEGEGTVLYFSFEEDRSSVLMQFLNCYANLFLSHNNLRSIDSFYKRNKEFDLNFIKEGQSNIDSFKRKEVEFNAMLKAGKLKVFSEDFSSQDLIDAIKYYNSKAPVKAVFVDYMQLLQKEGNRDLQLREELKQIGKDLKDLAVELKLPVVVAAQLNREANNPASMSSQNIADSADIERIANIVLCLWNSAFKPFKNNGSFSSTEETHLESSLKEFNITLGERGYMYAKLTKNRGGIANLESVFQFDGNTGRITPIDLQPEAVRDFSNIEPERKIIDD